MSLLIKHKFHHIRYEMQLKGHAVVPYFLFLYFTCCLRLLLLFFAFVFIDVAATCRAVVAAVSQGDPQGDPGGDIMTAA